MIKPERHSPFPLSQPGANVPYSILDAANFRDTIIALPIEELAGFLRAHVRSRIPAAFSEAPMLWEAVRNWLAARLMIDAHEIGLVGSAQVGFSTGPHKFGKPFSNSDSDFDFFIVSSELYEHLIPEVRRFCSLEESNSETKYRDQIDTLSGTARRNFFDLKQVPLQTRYPQCANLSNIASMVVDKLKQHDFQLRHSYFRVYKTWDSYSRQILLTYVDVLRHLR